MEFKEIWLVRHAQSEGNAGNRTKDTQSNPLTDLGREQANQIANYLSNEFSPELIVHSKYFRTQQTMAPYVKQNPDIPVQQWSDVHEFTYLSKIKYADTTYHERVPHKIEFWKRSDPDYQDDETSESVNGLLARADNFLKKVMSNKNESILVFTHGQFIKTVWLTLLSQQLNTKISMDKLYSFLEAVDIPNTGILKLKLEYNEFWINMYHG